MQLEEINAHTMTPNCSDQPCPIEIALDIIGGKWKGVILSNRAVKPRPLGRGYKAQTA